MKTKPRPSATRSKAAVPRPRPDGADSPTRVRVRVLADSFVAIGPGKADLLEAIASTGSISAAAREMGMSYRRAWMLVDTMNACFRLPLVSTAKGGVEGGGASLTPTGRKALREYRYVLKTVDRHFSPLLRTRR
ncbi:MAG TPA: winged helix-turn-helix domain-containing protein [Gemmatimonadaceae bacterium]|nr:winged helix-turn-helix domain-containing protein [Gemmatimonadaceae bacterium]